MIEDELVERVSAPRSIVAVVLSLSRPNVGGRDAPLKVLRGTSLGAHIAPYVAPEPFSGSGEVSENPAISLSKRDHVNAPDRIRTCDLRFRSPSPWVGWTTWD
jgi:hypothetical protein